MKVLNISKSDWANFAYDNMNALKSVDVFCKSFVMNKHIFYPKQSDLADLNTLIDNIKDADFIQFFHDDVAFFRTLIPYFSNKKVIVYHTSSIYRRDFAAINQVIEPYTYKHVCAMPELMKNAPEPIYIVGAVDTDALCPQEKTNTEIIFAHYPSNAVVKGTENILKVMKDTDVVFRHSTETVSYDEQIKRMSECDVYIEMLSDFDGYGSKYGNFGITGLEAAALGKIVITQLNDSDPYYQNYGFCAFNIVKSAEKLKRTVKTFSNYTGDYIVGQKQITRDWVVKNHSYKATGEYILKTILT